MKVEAVGSNGLARVARRERQAVVEEVRPDRETDLRVVGENRRNRTDETATSGMRFNRGFA